MSKLRKYLFGLILALAAMAAAGQNDSLYQDSLYNVIINHVTDDEIIENGIGLIIKKLDKNDFAEGKRVESYLLEHFEDTQVKKTGWKDHVLLSFLANDFYTPLNAYQIKMDYSSTTYSNLYWKILSSKAKENAAQIKQNISESSLLKKEKEFLAILFDGTLSGYYAWHRSGFVDEYDIAQRAEHFLLQYPQEDVLTVFVRENYSKKHYEQKKKTDKKQYTKRMYNSKRRPYRFGYGVMLSADYSFYDNPLSSAFKTKAPGFTLDADLSYHSFMLLTSLNFPNISFYPEKISQNLTEKSKISSHIIDLAFGYNVFNHGYFRIIPFGGVSWASAALSDVNDEENPVFKDIKYSFNPVVGLIIDYKLFKRTTRGFPKPRESFFPIRLKYSYHFLQFDKKYPELKGGIHQITLGIGFSANGFKFKENKND